MLSNVNAENCENQLQENILDTKLDELKTPIKSSEKAEVAETVPTSELDQSCSESVESLTCSKDGPGVESANSDPMDDLLSGFEKIKIAATPKPPEGNKLFDYNISTGEIEEVKQILEPIVEQRLRIDFEESDNVSLDNIEEQKDLELKEEDIQGKICEAHSVSEPEVSETKKEDVNDDSLAKENCNESTSETLDGNKITDSEVLCNILEVENTLDILKEDESNIENADKNTIDVLEEPSSDLLEINNTESSASLDSAVKPSEDQITKTLINTSEVTTSDKGKEIGVENETSKECKLILEDDSPLVSDNSNEKLLDCESTVQMNDNNKDAVEIQEHRFQSEEAQFDSLPDLEHIESTGDTNIFSGPGRDHLRDSVELDIPPPPPSL